MNTQRNVSRRRLLQTAGAGSLVMAAGYAPAVAQGGKRIEQLDPKLDAILGPSQPVQELGSGFGGELPGARRRTYVLSRDL